MVKSKSKLERIKGKGALLLKRRKTAQHQHPHQQESEQAAEDDGVSGGNTREERKLNKKKRFLQKLEQAQNSALKAKAAIGKKKGKRKGLSKALQDFSAFQKSLDNSLLAGVGKKSGLKAKTSSSKSKILKSESERLSAVVSHPQYQLNPLEAIQNHLNQTLPTEKTTPGRPSRTTKTLTEREKKQIRYRKKMEKEANRMMDM